MACYFNLIFGPDEASGLGVSYYNSRFPGRVRIRWCCTVLTNGRTCSESMVSFVFLWPARSRVNFVVKPLVPKDVWGWGGDVTSRAYAAHSK